METSSAAVMASPSSFPIVAEPRTKEEIDAIIEKECRSWCDACNYLETLKYDIEECVDLLSDPEIEKEDPSVRNELFKTLVQAKEMLPFAEKAQEARRVELIKVYERKIEHYRAEINSTYGKPQIGASRYSSDDESEVTAYIDHLEDKIDEIMHDLRELEHYHDPPNM